MPRKLVFPYEYISNPGPNNRRTVIIYKSEFEVFDALCNTEERIISANMANIRLIIMYSPSGSQRKAEKNLIFAKDITVHFQ